MTIEIETPSHVDMVRYLAYITELEELIASHPDHPMVWGWKNDLTHYQRLYQWANDNLQSHTKALQKIQPKTLWQRLFGR